MSKFRLVFFLFMTALIISCQEGENNPVSSNHENHPQEQANHHEYKVHRKKLKLSSSTEVPLIEGEVSADWFVMVEDNFDKTYLIFKDSDLHDKISDQPKECLVFETVQEIGNYNVLFHADEKYNIAAPGLKEFKVPVIRAGRWGCIPQFVMRARNRGLGDRAPFNSSELLVLNNKGKKALPVFVAAHPDRNKTDFHCGLINVIDEQFDSIETFINQGNPYEVYAGFGECKIQDNVAFPKKVKMLRELVIE